MYDYIHTTIDYIESHIPKTEFVATLGKQFFVVSARCDPVVLLPGNFDPVVVSPTKCDKMGFYYPICDHVYVRPSES